MRHRHLLLVPLVLALLCASSAAGAGGSTSLVVAELYASGGNSGATDANDYVELFNRGSSPVDLSGWTLQYASAASTSWSPTTLSGTIAPGHAYLVQLASGGANGAALPAADAVGTTNLAATGGKVAIVDDTTALACGASAGSCAGVATIADLIGYGTATDYEGTAAPAPSATSALARGTGGCTDTDSNGDDFTTADPSPRNSTSAASACSGGGSSAPGSASAAVRLQIQPVISIALGQPTLDFGSLAAGATATPVTENVTVTSNGSAGYSLTVHRTAFSPRDLPLGIAAAAPAGGVLGAGVSATVLAALPIAPAADLLLGQTSAAGAAGGDVWATRIGFTSALPAVPPGQYT
ncbi:MAG: lamin tail domain-containing protein, partial [Gaiellaceae bacterium]